MNGGDQISLLVDEDVLDEAESDTTVAPEKYAISSFGIDFDVEGLVRRLRKDEIFVPPFQRSFVWNQREASQFIESLLLGLPVPGIFLAKERDSQKMMIIDGQQRLKSLQYFFDGVFRPEAGDKKQQVFDLVQVQPQLQGRTYKTLEEDDRIRLENSVIHATIIKQESPVEEDDSSLYYVFGRLNTGGRKLSPQEIRSAIYHGPLIDLIEHLNTNTDWRALFGPDNIRLKDRELILRFIALFYASDKYARPMEEFLNNFCRARRAAPSKFFDEIKSMFDQVIALAMNAFGKSAFRPARSINAAAFDSIAVGLARRLAKGPVQDLDALREARAALALDEKYVAATGRSTSDEASVSLRLELATKAFAEVA